MRRAVGLEDGRHDGRRERRRPARHLRLHRELPVAAAGATPSTSTTATAPSRTARATTGSIIRATPPRRRSSTTTATATSICSCSATPATPSAGTARRRCATCAARSAGRACFATTGPASSDVSAKAGIYGGDRGLRAGRRCERPEHGRLPGHLRRQRFPGERLSLRQQTATAPSPNPSRRRPAHTSRFSMGVDAADVNDDGRPDLFVADMLPEREDILKTSASTEGFNLFNQRLSAGYHPQYARNTLQLNRGDEPVQRHRLPRGRSRHRLELGAAVRRSRRRWAQGSLRHERDLPPAERSRLHQLRRRRRGAGGAVATGITSREPGAAAAHAAACRCRTTPSATTASLRFTDVTRVVGARRARLLERRRVRGPEQQRRARPGREHGRTRRRRSTGIARASRPATRRSPSRFAARARTRRASAQSCSCAPATGRSCVEQMPTRGFQSSVDPRLHVGLGRAATVDSLTWSGPTDATRC